MTTFDIFLNEQIFHTPRTIPRRETHIVPTLSSPVRLQEYGVGIFEAAITKSALKKALKKGFIKVNDKHATSATIIQGGEIISFIIPENDEPKKQLNLDLEVLFEDDHLAIIHKPAGILVSGNKFRTIANALAQNLSSSSLEEATLPKAVHRLDYPTSGALLVGKTSSSIRALNKMFENKEIEKTYYAITIRTMKESGTIDSEIDEKAAITNYELVESIPSERFGQLNLVKLFPKTGRRHQLRKHLSEIGNPILGDKEYGIENLILNRKGLYLHAFSLEFKHPVTNELIQHKDELPKKFKMIYRDLDL